MNDWPVITLRDEDRAVPPPDLQALGIALGDSLQGAGASVVNLLHALRHTNDPFEAKRLALIWGEEAHTHVVAAMETREALTKGQRAAGLLSAAYGGSDG